VEKNDFMKVVAGVMRFIISHEDMVESLHRSCLRSQVENLELMEREEERVDVFIKGIDTIELAEIPYDTMDAIVLRYLRNMDFLANIEEQYIDVSTIGEEDLACWKKTMLFKKVPAIDIVEE
jgi:hypothetical protein